MDMLMRCPSCGSKILLYGNDDAFAPEDPILCPDCSGVLKSCDLAPTGADTRLKPCPFCGGEPMIQTDITDHYRYFWVRCANCCAYTLHLTDLRAVIDRWNRRANDAKS